MLPLLLLTGFHTISSWKSVLDHRPQPPWASICAAMHHGSCYLLYLFYHGTFSLLLQPTKKKKKQTIPIIHVKIKFQYLSCKMKIILDNLTAVDIVYASAFYSNGICKRCRPSNKVSTLEESVDCDRRWKEANGWSSRALDEIAKLPLHYCSN